MVGHITWECLVLGPLPFVLYTADLGRIAGEHGISAHFYTDDSQLYMSAKPQHTEYMTAQLLGCMEAIGQWMASNRLKLNPVNIDLLWCVTHWRLGGVWRGRSSVLINSPRPWRYPRQ